MTLARQWLDRILAGEVPDPTTVDELRASSDEGQHLDFKDGKLTGKKAERNEVMREYASAFSNAEGGLLVIGVSDDKQISPCEPVGNRPLNEWAKSTLIDLAHLLQPPPRFHVVEMAAGKILVVAFARTPQLVPVVDGSKWTYFLRFHDGNKPIPEYLLADLMLGRRQHPAYRVTPWKDTPSLNDGPNTCELPTKRLGFAFRVENLTLVPADDVEVGVLGWTCDNKGFPLGPHLAQYVDQVAPRGFPGSAPWAVIRRVRSEDAASRPTSIRGLGTGSFPTGGSFTLPFDVGDCRGSFAVYVCGKGHVPAWFEMKLTFRCTSDGSRYIQEVCDLEIEPAVGRRPVVSWTRP